MLPVETENLLITVAPLRLGDTDTADVEEPEGDITDSASKLYELKEEKFIDLDVLPETENAPYLFVTIGPDDSPPEDEPEDESAK